MGVTLALLRTAIAVLSTGVGSAVGIGTVDQATAEVVTEDPNKFSKVLVLQLFSSTRDTRGLPIAFTTLTQIDTMGGSAGLSLVKDALYLIAYLPMGIAGWISGASQGRAAAAGIGLVTKRPEQFDKAMVFPAMVETYATLVLLISILSILGIAGPST